MPDLQNYAFGLAQRNKRVAEHNADAVDQWMAYANKVKVKLSAVEQERDVVRLQLDAMRQERDALVTKLCDQHARSVALDALQDKLAAELGKVSPLHALTSSERRKMIVEAAVRVARAPSLRT